MRDSSIALNLCVSAIKLAGEMRFDAILYNDLPNPIRESFQKEEIDALVVVNNGCKKIKNEINNALSNDYAAEKYRFSNRKKDQKPLSPENIAIDTVLFIDVACKAAEFHNRMTSNKIAMWACDEVKAWRQFGMVPPSRLPPLPPPLATPNPAYPKPAGPSVPPVALAPLPSSEPQVSSINKDVLAWQSDKLSIDERHRNNDMLYNLCISVQENTANGILPPVAHILDFPSDHRWNGKTAGLEMSFAIGSIKLQCTPEQMMANRIYDASERARAQRPDRRGKTIPPIPPTTNNDIIRGFMTVCGFLDGTNRSKFKNAWLCDQLEEWRRYGMFPKAP